MKRRIIEAVSNFNNGFNCSQAILSTYAPLFGLDKKTALRISCGFGSGIAGMQEICGALSGSFMFIGLKYGNDTAENVDSKEKTYEIIRKFTESFKKEFGSIKCKEIIGCDLNTEEGMKYYEDNSLASEKCSKCVEAAARLVNKILL